jgi:hypothetical protein
MMKHLKLTVVLTCFVFLLSACPKRNHSEGFKESDSAAAGTVDFPGDETGARQLLSQFFQAGMDKEALTKKLRPHSGDFSAVFKPEVAKQVEEGYREPWDQGKIVIHAKPGETELLLGWVTTGDLQKQNEAAAAFPIGYAKAAPYFNEGLKIYRFKFVRPGEQLGFAWDGLIFVNGHWAFFPKPWRVIPGLVLNVPAPEDP